MIKYPPESLCKFKCYIYEWIDDLRFILPIDAVVENAAEYEEVAKSMFKRHNWQGDGSVGILWVPPFAIGGIVGGNDEGFLKLVGKSWAHGLHLWHVKQKEDGLSFILSPIELQLPDIGIIYS